MDNTATTASPVSNTCKSFPKSFDDLSWLLNGLFTHEHCCIQLFLFSAFTFIFSMIYPSCSSLLSGSWSLPSLYPTALACFYNWWQDCLCLCSCHPCPYFPSCLTLHSLLLECHPSWCREGNILTSSYLAVSKMCINHLEKNPKQLAEQQLSSTYLSCRLIFASRAGHNTVPPVSLIQQSSFILIIDHFLKINPFDLSSCQKKKTLKRQHRGRMQPIVFQMWTRLEGNLEKCS